MKTRICICTCIFTWGGGWPKKKLTKSRAACRPELGNVFVFVIVFVFVFPLEEEGGRKKSWQRAEHRVVLDCAMLTRESWRGRRHFQRVQNTWKRGSKGLKSVTLVQVVYRQVWKQDQYHTQWAFDGSKVSNFGGCVILDDNNKTHRMTTRTSILTVPIMWVSSNMKITRT